MRRADLEHLIRAAATIAEDDELIIIGSQAILGQFPDAPPELLVSVEADLYPRNRPERADLVDYRGEYRNLPDMGKTYRYFRNHGTRADVDQGYYDGNLDLQGRGFHKVGAGKGQTVIDGHLDLRHADNWVLSGMTITGNVTVRGSNNDLSGCDIFGTIDVKGTGNKFP